MAHTLNEQSTKEQKKVTHKAKLCPIRMVTHFRGLAAHRLSVLELYRALLRHSTHLQAGNTARDELIRHVRMQFKRQKGQMSVQKVTECLNRGYSLEEKLRTFLLGEDDVSIDDIRAMVSLNDEKPTNKYTQLKNRFGQRVKRDVNNQQPLETQQIRNYVSNYVRRKQRAGLLPRMIDPLILEHIIKPEALHQRAKMDIDSATEKIGTGPYRVHVTESANVQFLRGPWPQSPKISPLILSLVRQEQRMIDYLHYYDNNSWLYKYEDSWEWLLTSENCDRDRSPERKKAKVDAYSEEAPWGMSVKQDISTMSHDLENKKRAFREYSRTKLASKMKQHQLTADKIHETMKKRLEQLVTESKGVTAFEDLLHKPTLRQLVRKHKFLSK